MSETIEPLKNTIEAQAAQIIEIVGDNTVLSSKCKNLEEKVESLQDQLEELVLYGRRNSLRFHNVDLSEREQKFTDPKIIDMCNSHMNTDISHDDIFRSHIIGKPNKDGKYQVICRFRSWNVENIVYHKKKHLKHNPARLFITEDLTKTRKAKWRKDIDS